MNKISHKQDCNIVAAHMASFVCKIQTILWLMADPVQPGFTGFIFFFKILSSALRIQCYLQTAKFQQYSSYIVATFQLHFSYISLFFMIPILSSASRIQFYLQTSPGVFVQIADCICQNCKLYLSKFSILSSASRIQFYLQTSPGVNSRHIP